MSNQEPFSVTLFKSNNPRHTQRWACRHSYSRSLQLAEESGRVCPMLNIEDLVNELWDIQMRQCYSMVNISRVKYSSHCSNFLVIKMSSMTSFHVFESMYVCVHTCAHMCSHMWKPEVNLEYCYSGIVHIPFFYFEKGFLTGLGLIKQSRLASQSHAWIYLPVSPCPELGGIAGILCRARHFYVGSEGKAQAPMLAANGKTLAN